MFSNFNLNLLINSLSDNQVSCINKKVFSLKISSIAIVLTLIDPVIVDFVEKYEVFVYVKSGTDLYDILLLQ